MIRKAAEQVAGIGPERLDQLMHIVLSHHGQLAYGSPVLPMTPEAMLLHLLDDMDAKMNYMDGLRQRMLGGGWQWTEYQRHLERYLYLRTSDAEDTGGGVPICPDEEGVEPPTPQKPSASSASGKKADEPRQPSLF
jgi:3'-5' exoribonuclease